MTDNDILENIKISIEREARLDNIRDCFDQLRIMYQPEDYKSYLADIKWLRNIIMREVKKTKDSLQVINLYDILKKTYLLPAHEDFESYMVYLEWNRKPEERFYQPRAKKLRPIVEGLQMLADNELDELFISQPPRTGKTTLLLFFTTWIIGKNSELSNLYSAYSDIITSAFYNGVIEILKDDYTYLWRDIFPNCTIANTNAKDEILNIDRTKR